MGNTGTKPDEMNGNVSISMPVRIDKTVNLANVDELVFALGIPQMEAPIPIGIIEMPNGLKVPVSLAISYLAGPDARPRKCFRYFRKFKDILLALSSSINVPKAF